MDVNCFITIFIGPDDGLKGLQSKQRSAEKILAREGKVTREAKIAKNLRRVTIYGTIHSKAGERSQQAIERVAREISQATERTAVGKPEGWGSRRK